MEDLDVSKLTPAAGRVVIKPEEEVNQTAGGGAAGHGIPGDTGAAFDALVAGTFGMGEGAQAQYRQSLSEDNDQLR